jgi:hypothetical protein
MILGGVDLMRWRARDRSGMIVDGPASAVGRVSAEGQGSVRARCAPGWAAGDIVREVVVVV